MSRYDNDFQRMQGDVPLDVLDNPSFRVSHVPWYQVPNRDDHHQQRDDGEKDREYNAASAVGALGAGEFQTRHVPIVANGAI